MPSTLYNPDGSRTGLRINASVRRKRYMGGGDQGPLSTRPTASEQWDTHERHRARQEFQASQAPAAEAVMRKPATSEPQPQVKLLGGSSGGGMLVPGPSGSAVWRTKEQLDADKAQTEARAKFRKNFVGPLPRRKTATFDGIRGMKGFAAAMRM